MAYTDWAPVFTLNELYEINDAVIPLLQSYLENGDPEQHELRYGTVSSLLEIVRKLQATFAIRGGAKPGSGLPDWFPELEQQVLQFRERASEMARQVVMPEIYAWDRWKTKALAAGVTEELATLGRAVMREHYQHGWLSYDNEVSARSGHEMLHLALSEPDQAMARWQWLLDTDGGQHVAEAA